MSGGKSWMGLADTPPFTRGSLRPTLPAPPLIVPTVDGPEWTLADQHPERFTMVVFYRGYHCPVCRTYLQELERALGDFAARGVEVIAVSGDDRKRATASKREWGLDRLTLGYGQPVASMREWGLFISTGNNPNEPAEFGEPGLFLVQPDGTLYYVALNSMPFGRPPIGDMLRAVDFIIARDYPARGSYFGYPGVSRPRRGIRFSDPGTVSQTADRSSASATVPNGSG